MLSSVILLLSIFSTHKAAYGCASVEAFEKNNRSLRRFFLEAFTPKKADNHFLVHLLFESASPATKGGHGEVRVIKVDGKELAIKKVEISHTEVDYSLKQEIELLKKICGQDPKGIESKLSECKSALIAGFYGCVEEEDDLYIFQEKMDRDLGSSEAMKLYSSLSGREKADAMLNIISKFEELHGKDIVHADIKPENLMMKGDDFKDIKIIDFGVSDFKGKFAMGGTRYFISPEQRKGDILRFEGDIYSLAITFAMMESSLHDYMLSKMDKACLDPKILVSDDCNRQFLEGVEQTFNEENGTEALKEIMAQAFSKERTQRYGSMKEFGEAIRAVQKDLPTAKPNNAKKGDGMFKYLIGLVGFGKDRRRRILSPATGIQGSQPKDTEVVARDESVTSKIIL